MTKLILRISESARSLSVLSVLEWQHQLWKEKEDFFWAMLLCFLANQSVLSDSQHKFKVVLKVIKYPFIRK
jgi:hypothetical protein